MPSGSRIAPSLLVGYFAIAALGFVDATSAQNTTTANANYAPNDPAGEWRMQARDFANTRYSTLDQINLDNVKRLRVAWTFSDGAAYGHEGAPLVVGSSM